VDRQRLDKHGMLALNEKLGFQSQGATVRFVNRLEETM